MRARSFAVGLVEKTEAGLIQRRNIRAILNWIENLLGQKQVTVTRFSRPQQSVPARRLYANQSPRAVESRQSKKSIRVAQSVKHWKANGSSLFCSSAMIILFGPNRRLIAMRVTVHLELVRESYLVSASLPDWVAENGSPIAVKIQPKNLSFKN